MEIAVLGWGSLIRNPRELQLAGAWLEGGPVLPIEFSRISDDGRLTLVIDERNGVGVPTRYAISSFANLDSAIANLQERERATNPNRIGFVDVVNDRQCERAQVSHPCACERIRAWTEERQFDAVVWTAIGPKFRDRIGEWFSVDAATRYLAALPEQTKSLALDYIRNAPADVVTPVRNRVETEFRAPRIRSGTTP